MSIEVACPKCDHAHRIADHLEGKRIRCKGCDRPFLVTENDEANEEKKARKPRRRPGRAKKPGVPIWVWGAAGGGALVAILLLVVVIVVVSRSRRAVPALPDQARIDLAKLMAKKDGVKPPPEVPGTPVTAPGPHFGIVEEFAASWNAAANAMAQVQDDASASSAAHLLRVEAGKMRVLTQRLETAGPASAADRPRLQLLQQQQLEPNAQRVENETRQLQQRLPSMKLGFSTASSLDQGIQSYGNAARGFVSLAKQYLP